MALISNYGTLKTAIAAYLNRSDLTAQLPYFVDYAHIEIGRNLRAFVNQVAAYATLNGETIATPTRFQAIKRIYTDTTPRRPLTAASPEVRSAVSAEFYPSTYPTHFSIEGSTIYFAPVPTGTPVVQVLYYEEPQALSADADTNPVLTAYPNLYLWGALAEASRLLMYPDQAATWESQFRGLISDINLADAKDALSGPVAAHVHAGGIV